MNGSIQRLTSGVTVVVTEECGDVVSAIVVHSMDPNVQVGAVVELDRNAIDSAQQLEFTTGTVGMLAYKVPTNRERIPA